MKPLSDEARAIFETIPADGAWIAPWHLQEACGLSLGNYYSHVGTLKRRGLVERNDGGDYRRAGVIA